MTVRQVRGVAWNQLDRRVRPREVTPLSILTRHGWQVRGFSLREDALVRGANGHVQRKPTPKILNGVTRQRVPHRGMILLVVLIVVTMVALAGYRFAEYVVIENKAVVQYGDALQARHAVGSGIELLRELLEQPPQGRQLAGGVLNNPGLFHGVALLEDDPLAMGCRFSIVAPPRDTSPLGGVGSGGVTPGGMVTDGIRFGVENESARLNLTVLDTWDHKQPGSGQAALMKLPGMTSEVADAILDWVDADSVPRESGAEDDYYQGLSPPYTARNGPPETLEELLLVRGVTRELLFGTRDQFSAPGATSATTRPSLASRLTGAMGQGATPWADLLTLYSAERNMTPDGRKRVYLNDSRLAQLHPKLAEALGKEWADYIVAYRQFGPYRGSQPVSDEASFRFDLKNPAQFTIASLLDLADGKVRVPGRTARDAIVLASPLAEDPQQMRVELPRLINLVSITRATKIVGRINVNLAPEAVLQAIPGLDEVTAGRIVASRQQGTDLAERADRQQAIWLLTEGLVEREKMKQLMPYVTAGGDVFRAQVVGFFDMRGPTARVELVIDAASSPAQIVSWKDLGALGLGYPRERLGSDQSTAAAVPAVGAANAIAPIGSGSRTTNGL
jgi:type II secretory pathway component PulK